MAGDALMSTGGFNPGSFSINSFSPLSFLFPTTTPSTPPGGIGNYRGHEKRKPLLCEWGKICRFNDRPAKRFKRKKRGKTMKLPLTRKTKTIMIDFIAGFGPANSKSMMNVLSKRGKAMSKRYKHKAKKPKKLHIRDRMAQNL